MGAKARVGLVVLAMALCSVAGLARSAGAATPRGTEVVTPPTAVSGPSTAYSKQLLTFIAKGATSSLGHALQYRFNWGDGSTSAWGGATQTHHYIHQDEVGGAESFGIHVQARCATHTSVRSAWSARLKKVTVWSPRVVITRPISSTVWTRGTHVYVKWDNQGINGSVSIALRRKGSTFKKTLTSNISCAKREFRWYVPKSLPAGSYYHVTIAANWIGFNWLQSWSSYFRIK